MFDDIEKRLLSKTLEIREKMVDHVISKGLPEKARDIDSITNLLESIDRSIFGMKKLKLEESNNKSIEETKEALIGILMNLHKNVHNTDTIVKEKQFELEHNENMNFEYREEEKDCSLDIMTKDEFYNK